MFDAVMATAGAPRRGSSKGASPGSVCASRGVCVASDALLVLILCVHCAASAVSWECCVWPSEPDLACAVISA